MPILWIIETFSTKTDRNGNTYHAAVIVNCLTGKNVRGLISSANNALSAWHGLTGGESSACYRVEHMGCGERALNRNFKDQYIHLSGQDLAHYVKRETA